MTHVEPPSTVSNEGVPHSNRSILGRPHSKRRMPRHRVREAIDGYLFIAPWLIGFVFLVSGPMVASLLMSFTEWDLLSPPRWIGVANFQQLFSDPLVGKSLYNTAFFTFFSVPLNLAAALGAALLLNLRVRGRSVFRTAFYLPAIMPAVANAILWFWILNPEVGLANLLLRQVGLPELRWLEDPTTAKPAFILMTMWSIGNSMVIFLAGLQGVPQSLYDAALVDGAGAWQRFRAVTLPMLSPVILFNLVLGIIGSFQIFTSAYLLTQDGGPEQSTLFSVLYLYRLGFEQFRMGYASAYAWLLFLVILVFSLLQLWMSRRWVYYEGGDQR
jgi:multiple sugar transport system permease protein